MAEINTSVESNNFLTLSPLAGLIKEQVRECCQTGKSNPDLTYTNFSDISIIEIMHQLELETGGIGNFHANSVHGKTEGFVYREKPYCITRFEFFPNPWSKILNVYINAPRKCTSEQSDKIKQFLDTISKYHTESYAKMTRCASLIEVTDDDLFNIDIPSMGPIDIGLHWSSD
jgi:hypothetical protein